MLLHPTYCDALLCQTHTPQASLFLVAVWQKLEEQNPDFFKAYFTRLKLKDQINVFNYLLEQQVSMVQNMQRGWMQSSGGMMMQPGVGMQNSMPMQSNMPMQQSGPMGQVQSPMQDGVLGGHNMNGVVTASMTDALGALPDFSADLNLSLPVSGPDAAHSMPLSGDIGLGPFPMSPNHSQNSFPTLDEHHLSTLPRNFSFGDLNLDQHLDHLATEGDHVLSPLLPPDGHNSELPGMPRNFSLSELAPLDVDLGGEDKK